MLSKKWSLFDRNIRMINKSGLDAVPPFYNNRAR
jgi:hypothetical protein